MAYSLPVGDTGARLDMFYPFFLTIQFAFYFGWLKVRLICSEASTHS